MFKGEGIVTLKEKINTTKKGKKRKKKTLED